MAKYMSRPGENPKEHIENQLNAIQSEVQGLTIQDSHAITINQVEVQGLVIVQAALQAALQAAIILLGGNNFQEIKQLQKISQTLNDAQFQSQSVQIINSGEITVNQTEAQIEVAVQAAIQLLAQLLLKIG